MLELQGVNSGYGAAQVLRDLSLRVEAGEILCLLGRNGAGKTTTMQTIMGLLPLMSGRITLDGQDVGSLPAHEVPRAGIGYIPQGRRLFAGLSVAQNLEIGLQVRGAGRTFWKRCWICSRVCASGWTSRRRPFRAESSRCWPRRGRCVSSPKRCCSMSRPRGYNPR